MLSKTHLTVGVAAALAVCPARAAGDLFAAVIGGALGGVLCDVECKDLPGRKDAFAGRLGAGALTVLLLAADSIMQAGLWTSIRTQPLPSVIVGALITLAVTVLYELIPVQLLSLFNASEHMKSIGIPALRIISLSFPLAAAGIVMGSIFQAFAKSIY